MKKHILSLLALACIGLQSINAQRPDSLWFRFDDRFRANGVWDISVYDTITFGTSMMKLTKPDGEAGVRNLSYYLTSPGRFMFSDPGRILYKPASMQGDYTNANSQWCFERSRESEHFVCFWEKGCTADITYLLNVAEKTWDKYTKDLGFVIPGQSSTDTYKIIIRAYNTTDWVASGSGEDMKVGTFNISPGAVTARGGHTVAHEIGHTFQYLTNVDCGANNTHGFNYGLGPNGEGGNGFWEDCANWMAYKVYPERQFTDGEYFEGYLARCHQNVMHEDSRYYNCFYQDFLCDRYGQDFIGRLWRESTRPEDPVDATKRLLNLSHEDFSALMYDIFAHMATWDTPSVHQAAKHRQGSHPMVLESVTVDDEEWFQVKADRCPQNYGYNITPLKMPAKGTTLNIQFQGLMNEPGYRHINSNKAGWRWGLAAQLSDGTTVYSPMQSNTASNAAGSLQYQVPEDATALYLTVMGAPSEWWHHQWDDNATNDEQWPYRVRIPETSPVGIMHTFTEEDFPADYVRQNDTIVVHTKLAYDAYNYSGTVVQYDMDAISKALGVSTAQLKAIKAGSSANPRFVGISKNGTLTPNTTTSTSSATVLGHWFTTGGNVCGYDGSAAIFAEMRPTTYECTIGQYPGRLKKGNAYVIRQGVIYKDSNNKSYRATIEVHIDVY